MAPWVLGALLPLLWGLAVAAVMLGMISSQAGCTATFSFPYLIISHLLFLSLLLLSPGQVHLMKNTILHQNVCKSQEKIFQSRKKGN